MKASSMRHEHSVDIGLSKETRRWGNDWWNEYLVGLTGLADMACLDEPGNVLIDVGPPKTIEEADAGGVDSFMA
jgi:hypothetical protein